jgi:hypothetical protein
MKNWSRRHTLLSGLAMILIINGVALLGVALNRSGAPESTLKLSQRELHPPFREINRENSGISLSLVWRVAGVEKGRNHSSYSGAPDWLDQAKMASLGFESSPARGGQDKQQWTEWQPGKEVLLVLEQDGAAYQQVLERTRQDAVEVNTRLAAQPDTEELQRKAKQLQDDLRREEQESSRLFAIDAGLDQTELRAKYPDRSRYAIVHAQVRPRSMGGRQGMSAGQIESLSIDTINVPHELRSIFELRATGQPDAGQVFEASVAFGQRLEPWLLGISDGAK